MHFGLFSLMTQRAHEGTAEIVEDTTAMVTLAEDIGFEIAWFAEHHFSSYSVSPSPLLVAGHFAAKTTRIKLGTGVIVLPLYHPVRLIEEMGIVDTLSDGRLVVGIGTGYQRFEFARFGSPYDEKAERSSEIIDIMEHAFATGRFSYNGKHYKLDDAPICDRLVNGRRPEIYIATAQPELAEKAAALRYIPFVTVGYQGIDAVVAKRRHMEAIYERHGVSPAAMPFGIQRYVYVTDSQADARNAAEQILYINRLGTSMRNDKQQLDGPMLRPVRYEGEASPESILETTIIGDPHHCAERIAEELERARPSHFNCFMQFGLMDGRSALRSLERFGAEVMPLLSKTVAGNRMAAAR